MIDQTIDTPLNPWQINSGKQYSIYRKLGPGNHQEKYKDLTSTEIQLASNVSNDYSEIYIESLKKRFSFGYYNRTISRSKTRVARFGSEIGRVKCEPDKIDFLEGIPITTHDSIRVTKKQNICSKNRSNLQYHPLGEYHELATRILMSYRRIFNFGMLYGESLATLINNENNIEIQSRNKKEMGIISRKTRQIPTEIVEYLTRCQYFKLEFKVPRDEENLMYPSTRERLREQGVFNNTCQTLIKQIQKT